MRSDIKRTLDTPTVAVALVTRPEDGRFLICRRSPGCTNAGEWEVPGGHIDPGETPDGAAAREVYEETGLHAFMGLPTDGVYFELRHAPSKYGIMIPGELELEGDSEGVRLKLDEHDAYAWVTIEELEDYHPLPPMMRESIARLLGLGRALKMNRGDALTGLDHAVLNKSQVKAKTQVRNGKTVQVKAYSDKRTKKRALPKAVQDAAKEYADKDPKLVRAIKEANAAQTIMRRAKPGSDPYKKAENRLIAAQKIIVEHASGDHPVNSKEAKAALAPKKKKAADPVNQKAKADKVARKDTHESKAALAAQSHEQKKELAEQQHRHKMELLDKQQKHAESMKKLDAAVAKKKADTEKPAKKTTRKPKATPAPEPTPSAAGGADHKIQALQDAKQAIGRHGTLERSVMRIFHGAGLALSNLRILGKWIHASFASKADAEKAGKLFNQGGFDAQVFKSSETGEWKAVATVKDETPAADEAPKSAPKKTRKRKAAKEE